MLEIFNILGLFFEDCYAEYGVREYARLIKVSPPTASTILKRLQVENLLKSRIERKNHLFRANTENMLFIDLSKAYWRWRLTDLTNSLEEQANYAAIILFGSLVKGEATSRSDLDLYVGLKEKKIALEDFEIKLKRKIQLHFEDAMKNKQLKLNIRKGLVLSGVMV